MDEIGVKVRNGAYDLEKPGSKIVGVYDALLERVRFSIVSRFGRDHIKIELRGQDGLWRSTLVEAEVNLG